MAKRKKIGSIACQFIDNHENPAKYKICLGETFANSLTGFLAGIACTSLICLLVIEIYFGK